MSGPRGAAVPRRGHLVIVFVIDGLRPDAITAEETPTLYRLRAEGVDFTNSHAVVPTVTRVNAATLATGAQPATHGIVGNQLYVPALDPRRAVDTGNYRNLVALPHVPTLADRLHACGLRLAAVSSGSTGSSFLLNPRAPDGVGALVNGYFDPGTTVAWPADLNQAILHKFGPAPPKRGRAQYDGVVAWAQTVLRDHVLPVFRPDVVINWLTEPDHSQHAQGVGSPAARAMIRHADAELAVLLAGLDLTATDLFVVSDHGFTTNTAGIDVGQALIDAGLKAGPESTDVVLASSGQAVGIHVAGRDVGAIARFIQEQAWGGVLFTAPRAPGEPHGVVDGTFSLELIHLASRERSPDLFFTFPWTSEPSVFGVPGADLANVARGQAPYHSDHGSMSPWNVRNTCVAWGPSFKRGVAVRLPVGTVDIAPTILALLGIDERERLDGRVLHEALADGPDPDAVAAESQVHMVESAGYRAAVQLSSVAGRRYVDASWRIAAG